MVKAFKEPSELKKKTLVVKDAYRSQQYINSSVTYTEKELKDMKRKYTSKKS